VPERSNLGVRIIPRGAWELKTRGSGVILRTDGESASHKRSRFPGGHTLEHAKTTEAEIGD